MQILLGLPMLEGSNPASRFPCSAIGYEAACYSRIWSEVCLPTISWNICYKSYFSKQHILHYHELYYLFPIIAFLVSWHCKQLIYATIATLMDIKAAVATTYDSLTVITGASNLQVFAADIFSSKFRGGLLNQYIGMQFRNKVNTLLFKSVFKMRGEVFALQKLTDVILALCFRKQLHHTIDTYLLQQY